MEMRYLSFAIFILLHPVTAPSYDDEEIIQENIQFDMVHGWAEKLGADLWHFGDYITKRKEVQNSFETAQVELRDGKKIVEQMAADISKMLELKIGAVKRIAEAAENAAIADLEEWDPKVPLSNKYHASKGLESSPPDNSSRHSSSFRGVVLTPDPHFNDIPVDKRISSVHVPTDVYDEAFLVMQAIQWSEDLDSVFTSNYKADPTLSWQYFGSTMGFMRHYPAMQWNEDPVDLYDCRNRPWYIEAAASPKNVVILLDNSGSMKGHKKEIGRHIVTSILDTLGDNDFVNIFSFNNTVFSVEPCFEGMLVQATLANVRELKIGLEGIETKGVTNFTGALTFAFELLGQYQERNQGAGCNQAIMLVTDEVPYYFKEVFETYNWQQTPKMPVRMFTYLIGRQVADTREAKWMACANQGYFVRLGDMSEVRERVLNYIAVMARPLVLWGDQHPIMWTPLYADLIDPKMTDFLWDKWESEEQKMRMVNVRKNITAFMTVEETIKRIAYRQKKMEDQVPGDPRAFKMITSVSMPVFDKTENGTFIGNLLGVAGTDIPIQDLHALMMSQQLGVNGYAYIVTNNGFVLTHPDFRPTFEGILKPNYNSVDMVEVELMDDSRGPRDFNPELIQFRSDVLSQTTGSKWMQVKYHFDSMKRVSRIRRQYFWTGIPRSVYSLVVALPEPYGLQRLALRPEDDIHRTRLKGNNATHFFRGRRWRVHPDWIYCRHHERTFPSREEELLYFLDRMRIQGWHWPLKLRSTEHIHCDRSLIQAVVYDARVTDWYTDQNTAGSRDDKGKEFVNRFGIKVAFMATHGGLTRWKTFSQSDDNYDDNKSPEFGERYPRAIDEVWYKRAVEQHYIQPSSFVYSVDFDAGTKYPLPTGNDTTPDVPLVTATHAVFHSADSKSASAAVVGSQFHHTSLHSLFINITSSCGDSAICTKTCKSEDLACYAVDNNGFVVVSEDLQDAGRFFGETQPAIMRQLVAEKIFRRVQVTDYQAACAEVIDTNNPVTSSIAGRLFFTPLRQMQQLVSCLISTVLWWWQHSVVLASGVHGYSYPDEEVMKPDYQRDVRPMKRGAAVKKRKYKLQDIDVDKAITINRTRIVPCDKEVWLYQLQQYPDKEKAPYKIPAQGCERPYGVQVIPGSNLLLVVVDLTCQEEEEQMPPLRVAPVELDQTPTCERASNHPLQREGPHTCINFHPNESQIVEHCGGGADYPSMSWQISLLFLLLALIASTFPSSSCQIFIHH